MEKAIPLIFVYLAIVVVIFLIFREVFCWYWKINIRISLQKETNLLLKRLIDNEYVKIDTQEVLSEENNQTDTVFCTNCGHKNEFGAEFCSNCSQRIE